MFGKSPGRVLPGISRQFLRHDVQAMSGHGRDASSFPGISRQFLGHGHIRDTSLPRQGRRSCPGRILVAMEKQPDFQAFLGNFYDTVVCGHDVQAMSRICPGRDRDAARFLGFFRQFLGQGEQVAIRMQPDFQAFLGHVWDTSWPRQGLNLIFRHFWAQCGGYVWARSASLVRDSFGHVEDAVGTQPDFQAFLGRHTKVAWYPSHVKDAGTRRHIFMHMKAARDVDSIESRPCEGC
ncbi:Hypothetical predicted protein [Olea europaea subsp. europaea]|uniref:Uncharacterized protein n=1 Tax=Olea europaea subsp. europaea TaxID=158383 RepID=A0A8S0QGP7_OLEEU|nr:Hypothetical predicted protein [Olea europaea subsp. europaea]